MSIATLLHNIGDIIEGFEKKLGISDEDAKAVRAQGAAILSAFATKWATDGKLALLALAAPHVGAIIADPTKFVSEAEAIVSEAANKELQVFIDDAKDALRTALIASPVAGVPANKQVPATVS